MNTQSVAKQIAYLIAARSWPGSSNAVFGSVVISQALPPAGAATLKIPFAMIAIGDGQADPDGNQEPDYRRQEFVVRISAIGPGDADLGQKPLVGGNRKSSTESEGRGVLELEAQLFAAVKILNADLGVEMQCALADAPQPAMDQNKNYIVTRDYKMVAWTTTDPFYHPCTQLITTGGSGQIAVSWKAAPDRWDRTKFFLTYKTGTAAPTSITDGTQVTLSSNFAISKTITGLAAGTYSLSVFVGYSDLNEDTTINNYSAALSKTSITVT